MEPKMEPKSEGEKKSMQEEAMEGVLSQAQGIADSGEKSFEEAVVDILASDGYTGGLYPALEEALKEKDVKKLIDIAHKDGWL